MATGHSLRPANLNDLLKTPGLNDSHVLPYLILKTLRLFPLIYRRGTGAQRAHVTGLDGIAHTLQS